MVWSTRQLAELAGTTVKAVRHYHQLGLLAEPERGGNGYKRYRVLHLQRLLRIRRLTDLGIPLSQIAALGEADEHPAEALRLLDAELAATIDRLQGVRDEIATMLHQQLPTDLPPELAPVVDKLTDADRALMVVLGRVLDPSGVEAYRRMLVDYRTEPAGIEFDALTPDADEQTRQQLAEQMMPQIADLRQRFPEVRLAHAQAPNGPEHLHQTLALAIQDVYNSAQLDVLARVGRALQQKPAGEDGQQ